ncbi:MAG: TIR domain-containing protein [Verrucomicrobiota bacterium]
MNSLERLKTAVITKFASEDAFSEADWCTLGQITGKLALITEHQRLFRAKSFGDGDYGQAAAEVLDRIFAENSASISDVIEHFEIDTWCKQRDPQKWQRIFLKDAVPNADFWKEGNLKLFLSHLSSGGKGQIPLMRAMLATWGISAFVAKEDIQPSREWRLEVEAALETMEVMVPVVEQGFKLSDWCAQEVGWALGRKIEIIPLCIDLDPFGFFGKIQGIQIKGKTPRVVTEELVQQLLKMATVRPVLLPSMGRAFATLTTAPKLRRIELLDAWSIVSDEQIRDVIEASSLSQAERQRLKNTIARVGAFKIEAPSISEAWDDDDVPF